MDAAELYRAGNLAQAIEAATAAVRKKPADIVPRGFLSELLCIAGNLDRADAQLEIVTNQQPEAIAGVSLMRQLIRAARSRQEFFDAGRVPEVLSEPTPSVRKSLEAQALLRSGDTAGAAKLLQEVEETRPKISGTMISSTMTAQGEAGKPFADLRDLDDLACSVFEVLTSTGKYYWVPMENVVSLSPRKPERPIDLLWLPAEMSVKDGPDGVVYIPSIYGSTALDGDASLLLGRATEWDESAADIVRGTGLRMFLMDDADLSPFELGEIEFDQAADAS
ncbi:MAG: type VI secretion system protein ImpE [Neolewinella sp.]|jgi:type VI secretion system protein ImpE